MKFQKFLVYGNGDYVGLWLVYLYIFVDGLYLYSIYKLISLFFNIHAHATWTTARVGRYTIITPYGIRPYAARDKGRGYIFPSCFPFIYFPSYLRAIRLQTNAPPIHNIPIHCPAAAITMNIKLVKTVIIINLFFIL